MLLSFFGLYIFGDTPKISKPFLSTYFICILHIWVYQLLNRQCIFGFPQYEPIPIHLDPFHLNFDFHFSSGWGISQPVPRVGQTTSIWIWPDPRPNLRTGKNKCVSIPSLQMYWNNVPPKEVQTQISSKWKSNCVTLFHDSLRLLHSVSYSDPVQSTSV